LLNLTVCFLGIGIATPGLSQTQEYQPQLTTDGSPVPTTWELQSCMRQQDSLVVCLLSLTTGQDHSYEVSTDHDTKIVDAEGNEYYLSRIHLSRTQVGNIQPVITSGEPPNPVAFNVAPNASNLIIVDFTGIPTSLSQIALLQVGNSGSHGVEFQNVPIINPDGSSTVIPNSNQPSVNTQGENNSAPRRRVCIPLVGCF
jgi:hypothetical protein